MNPCPPGFRESKGEDRKAKSSSLSPRSGSDASVNVASMSDSDHQDDQHLIFDRVYDPVIACPDPKEPLPACQGLGIGRPRVFRKFVDLLPDPFLDPFREFPEFPGGGWLKDDLVGHDRLQAKLLLQLGPRDSPLFPEGLLRFLDVDPVLDLLQELQILDRDEDRDVLSAAPQDDPLPLRGLYNNRDFEVTNCDLKFSAFSSYNRVNRSWLV